MKRLLKAVVLSTIVYPGAGHILLKKYVSATVLIGIASVAVCVLVINAASIAIRISEKIMSGEVQLDIAMIRDLIAAQQSPAETQAANIATACLVATWLIGIVDAYRVGRNQANCDDNES